MSPEKLALMRMRVADNAEGDVSFGRNEVADLLDYVGDLLQINAGLKNKITTLQSVMDQYQAQIAHALKELREGETE